MLCYVKKPSKTEPTSPKNLFLMQSEGKLLTSTILWIFQNADFFQFTMHTILRKMICHFQQYGTLTVLAQLVSVSH